MKNVYIVGFMGTGKTVVGRLIAQKQGKEFIEMDEVIEERAGIKIVDIFSQKGEVYFRSLESELLKEISNKKGLIVSCGGGLVCRRKNLELLKSSGTLIALTASAEAIYERTKKNTQRPLLNVSDPLEEIKSLLKKRINCYNKAHHVIDTEDDLPEKIAEKIIVLLNGT